MASIIAIPDLTRNRAFHWLGLLKILKQIQAELLFGFFQLAHLHFG